MQRHISIRNTLNAILPDRLRTLLSEWTGSWQAGLTAEAPSIHLQHDIGLRDGTTPRSGPADRKRAAAASAAAVALLRRI